MPAPRDYSGTTINGWLVISKHSIKHTKTYYNCACPICKEISVRDIHQCKIRDSCLKCLNFVRLPKDYTNVRHCNFVFLRSTGERSDSGHRLWETQCDCGHILNRVPSIVMQFKTEHCEYCNIRSTGSERSQDTKDKFSDTVALQTEIMSYKIHTELPRGISYNSRHQTGVYASIRYKGVMYRQYFPVSKIESAVKWRQSIIDKLGITKETKDE